MADDTRTVALRYFDAVARRDVEGMVACWRPGGIDRFVGQQDLEAPDGVRDYFTTLFGAFPDMVFEVLRATTEEDRCTVQYRLTGTFAGDRAFQGFEPNGARVELEGADVMEVTDGEIVRNSAYIDGAALARQLGALPPMGSRTEARMAGLFNAGTRVARKLGPSGPERVADGVWIVRGGLPRSMNVFLIEDDGGVTVFDAGIKAMVRGVAAAGARLGGIRRVVLGHGHADHRGVAPYLGVPVYDHPADRPDAEAESSRAPYFDFSRLERGYARAAYPHLLDFWDGGPVKIAGHVDEGDDVAGFRVVHLPGHAPGLIALFRESDRLALTSDCFYTLDPQTGKHGAPRVPHRAFNADTDRALASMRKLAALEPAAAWPGHADPLTGDVRAQLERAADTT
jgi:hydroxyacylglutathione hydrolase